MKSEDIGKLILRATLGGLTLLHGISKVVHGPAFIKGLVVSAGMPELFAYLVYVGEVLAPALVLLGVFARPAALVIAINMVVAILLVHTGELFSLGKSGGWSLELQGFFLFTALAVAALGAGRLSLGPVGNDKLH